MMDNSPFNIDTIHKSDKEIVDQVKKFTANVAARLADGESVTITRNEPGDPHGMFTVTFPAGLHERSPRIRGGEGW